MLQIAFSSAWPVSAIFAALVLAFGYIFVPFMASNNPVLNALAQGVKPIALAVAGFFGLISFVKLIFSRRRVAPEQKAGPIRKLPQRARPMAANPPPKQIAPEVRLEPGIAPPPTPLAKHEWSLDLIQAIEWKRFEDVCQKFYEAKGIRSACTPLGPDGGIDIRLFQDDSGLATAIVQCKAWGSSYVGVKPIREMLGVMVHEKVAKAFFMTSGKYSDEAKAFATPNRITLIDGTMLLAMFKRLPVEASQKLLKFATQGDYNIPSCPTCGRKMRFIAGKDGKRDFWGCPSFPKCRQRLWAKRGASNIPTAMYE